jgi:hypothetical protein
MVNAARKSAYATCLINRRLLEVERVSYNNADDASCTCWATLRPRARAAGRALSRRTLG